MPVIMPNVWKGGEAMSRQKPMLMESPLTKRVYVVTRYKDEGNGVLRHARSTT